jgi:hypothetical protein
MAASVHRYSQSVLVSVCISRQDLKVVHYWQCQQHTVPEFAMRFRMIAQWRAATGAWSGLGRIETASLPLRHQTPRNPGQAIGFRFRGSGVPLCLTQPLSPSETLSVNDMELRAAAPPPLQVWQLKCRTSTARFQVVQARQMLKD